MDALHSSEADVEHVSAGGLQRPLADGELHAGHAPMPRPVVTGETDPFLTGTPHAEKPRAPV